MHTLPDLRGSIPTFISLTPGNVHDVWILDILLLERDSVIAIDRGYIDFARLYADIYKQRWQVELIFRWIKQHLRIKTFYGISPNAVKIQIWTAVSTYLLVAIMKKRLQLPGSLHTILQILEVNIFEERPIIQIVKDAKTRLFKG